MSQRDVHDSSSVESGEGESVQTRRPRARSSRSLSSLRRSRTRSRPRSPHSHLHRIYSAGFHDDHGTYVDPEHVQRAIEEANAPEDDVESSASLSKEKSEEEKEGLEEVESQDWEPTGDEPRDDRAGENADLEKAPSMRRQQTNKSARSQRERDPNMVSWTGPDDPENPKNWSMKRKWTATFVVSSFTFISPVASSMVAPALPQMAQDLGVHDEVLSQMMLSIFLLAYAVGPLFLGPLSELYGRVPVLQLANLVFLVFNLVCGFATTGPQMLVFRFFAGIGGSAPLAIGGGILADCFHAEQRGKAIAIYSLAPLLGPAAVRILKAVSFLWSRNQLTHISRVQSPVALYRRIQHGDGYFGPYLSRMLPFRYLGSSSCKKRGRPSCWRIRRESFARKLATRNSTPSSRISNPYSRNSRQVSKGRSDYFSRSQ